MIRAAALSVIIIVCVLAQPVTVKARSLQDHSPRDLLSMNKAEWVAFALREQCGDLRTQYDEFGGVFPANLPKCLSKASASYNRFQVAYPLLQYPYDSMKHHVGYCVLAMVPDAALLNSQNIPQACFDYARSRIAQIETAGG